MKELFIYRGLPGSGKTTRAKELQKSVGGRLVGRDHIRDLLWGLDVYVPTSRKESMVTAHQEKMIREGLRDDQPVIVDDMNLRAKYVRRFMEIAHEEGAEFSVIDMTDVPLDTCLWQNDNRDHKVPDGVITELHKRFIQGQPYPLPLPELPENGSQGLTPYVPQPGTPKAVIVDIDGTVALMGARSPYDFSKVHLDEGNEPIIDLIWRLYQTGFKILFTSGRSAECRKVTKSWLYDHTQLVDFELFMRNEGDTRRDSVVKAELFDKHIRYDYDVRFVLDDRNQVVEMWRALGLTCLQVAEGNF